MIASPLAVVTELYAQTIEPDNFMVILRTYEVDPAGKVLVCVPNQAFGMNLTSRFKGDFGFFDSGTLYWFEPGGQAKGAIRDALTRADYSSVSYRAGSTASTVAEALALTLELVDGR